MTYAKKEAFEDHLQQLADFTKALSHPARMAILEYLAKQSQCISGDITGEIPLSRSTVSQHLQELKSAGLIKGTVSGTRVYYCIDTENVKKLKSEMHDFMERIAAKTGSCKVTEVK